MKKPKPRFKKGDFLYYINSFDEVKEAKVIGRIFLNDCWSYDCRSYDCTGNSNFFYISDTSDSYLHLSTTYKRKIDAFTALREFLLQETKRVQKQLIEVELEIEKLIEKL